MQNNYRKLPISSYLFLKRGISLSYLAKKYELNPSLFYNFNKGLSRNQKVEAIYRKYRVPKKLIDETFNKEKKSNV